MIHPAVQAVFNMQKELNARLARIGRTAVQELLQPLFASDTSITGIAWSQGTYGGQFATYHRQPTLLVAKSDAPSTHGIFPQKVVGTLGTGWASVKSLTFDTRRIYLEKIKDFNEVPNDFLKLVFGESPVDITIIADGRVEVTP